MNLLESVYKLVLVIALIFALVAVIRIVVKLVLFWRKLHDKQVVLEIIPLRKTEQIPYSTQQLFLLLHGLAKQQSWLQRIVGETKNYSFEIVSSKEEGIRYLVRVSEEDAPIVKHEFLAYLSGMTVKEVKDYIKPNNIDNQSSIVSFSLSNHFALPLKSQNSLEDHDPIAYITGAMTKLDSAEMIAFQVTATPLKKSQIKDIKTITNLIYKHKELYFNFKNLKSNSLPENILKLFVSILLNTLFLPFGLLIFIFSEGRQGPFFSSLYKEGQIKVENAYQQELEEQIKKKLDQQLFKTSIRLLVKSKNKAHRNLRVREVVASLASFTNSTYQTLRKERHLNLPIIKRISLFLFKTRLHGLSNSPILSVTEVADIYHLPFSSTTKTEDIVKQQSKELPAPLSLKQKEALDIYFAKNTYGGTTTMIGLTEDERRRHVYILGATGTGKSTMLLSMVKQDIDNGKGVCVIDPHGDLAEKVLSLIPENRIKDVIYFNPDDLGYPIGINLLELSNIGSEDDKEREKEFITESIISLFHKLYSDKYSGPRMEYILRNTIHTAFVLPNPTLFTIYKLLMNTRFRKGVVAQLTDENLKDFWKYEFSKAGDYQKVSMIGPITNKIGRFLFSASARRILEQDKSSINFDEIMDSGKILLCNLSKGRLGEDNSEVFGIMVLTKIQLAALKRARQPVDDRKDFYLYVDEFQNFATPSFAQILSEARKYRLNATLAHQTTSQIEDPTLVNITLANTGTVICFRTANPEDEKLILPQFKPYVDQGEISNLPSFHFYMKIAAINPEEPFSGETIPINIVVNSTKVNEIVNSSRQLFAKEYKPIKPLITKLHEKFAKKNPKDILP